MNKRLQGVDLLRGLAIFLVLMNHVNIRLRLAKVPYTHGWPDQLTSSVVWNGQQGVQIFFAISGFLITSTALRRWKSLEIVPLKEFYRLRFARIAPLLLTLLAILSVLHFVNTKNYVINPKVATLPRALFAALTFHVNVLEAVRGYLPANWDILWSLSVEETFYLFFPLLCRHRRVFLVMLVVFIALGPYGRTHGNEVWREYSYLGSMDAIAMGCLTALIPYRPRAAPLLGAALLIFSLSFSLKAYALKGFYMSLVAFATCLLISRDWSVPRFLTPVRRLGERSYEVYLAHMFAVFFFLEWFVKAGKPMWLVPVFFVTAIFSSALLGEGVARWYSEPLNRRLRGR
jgi:peptidoglycan/LPS O-acetylase OafA/YrhL